MSSKPILVSIEGNIGSGKTTIIEKLEKKLGGKGIVFLREPLSIWESIKDASGENILQKFYADPVKYAFPFQVMAYATRVSIIRQAIRINHGCSVIVCERSLDADRHIFAKMLHDEGKIDDMCYQIYEMFNKELSDEIFLDGIVYIDADAQVCRDRIKKRCRDGEEGIPLEYLEKCKRYHDDWLNEHNNEIDETPILRIKTNQDVTYDATDATDQGNKWLVDIEAFVLHQIEARDQYLEWKNR
jgi:deoxyadenosine/deoxycytidine kinase